LAGRDDHGSLLLGHSAAAERLPGKLRRHRAGAAVGGADPDAGGRADGPDRPTAGVRLPGGVGPRAADRGAAAAVVGDASGGGPGWVSGALSPRDCGPTG